METAVLVWNLASDQIWPDKGESPTQASRSPEIRGRHFVGGGGIGYEFLQMRSRSIIAQWMATIEESSKSITREGFSSNVWHHEMGKNTGDEI